MKTKELLSLLQLFCRIISTEENQIIDSIKYEKKVYVFSLKFLWRPKKIPTFTHVNDYLLKLILWKCIVANICFNAKNYKGKEAINWLEKVLKKIHLNI